MRLDEFLVLRNYFSSKTKAQRAIRAGQVFVDGKVIKKPGFRVKSTSNIVISSVAYEKPIGYFKLKSIESHLETPIFTTGVTVLDIGSSAGGFVLYALECGASFVLGIEISNDFKKQLLKIKEQYPDRVDFLFGDATKLHTQILQKYSYFDVITCDITADPYFTINLIKLYSFILKTKGIVIFTLKLPKPYLVERRYVVLIEEIKSELPGLSLNPIKIIQSPDKHEIYVVAKKE